MQYTFSGGKLIDSTDKGEKKKENNNVATETKADSSAGGYGRGMGYSNRETAFRWSDGRLPIPMQPITEMRQRRQERICPR